jgi:hypothetical protein
MVSLGAAFGDEIAETIALIESRSDASQQLEYGWGLGDFGPWWTRCRRPSMARTR